MLITLSGAWIPFQSTKRVVRVTKNFGNFFRCRTETPDVSATASESLIFCTCRAALAYPAAAFHAAADFAEEQER